MRITTAPHAIEARAAFSGYSAFPRRVAPLLAMRLTVMREYAANRNHVAIWADTAKQVHEAITAVCFAQVTRRRKYRRIASHVALDAIVAYEKAYVVTLLRDEAGHYHPAPGTEFPFAVSDIGRAAADLLGDEWSVDSGFWGVRAFLQAGDERDWYTLTVSDSGVLRVEALPEAHRTDIYGVWPSDGLADIAARVADIIRELRKGD
ncbi:hypothetical protein EDD90_2002 [Streptomyces sp. Ag109_O5-1]|uniref:hypothetical protein n=1 Tax=Streptomyces sp. Ag109_O5-1 TaxID=1938851 RepID=UPI000F50D80B|nr:hypothetical protein [Streptomyces sp. Ag109_O5-1]RPE39047.1 hypothetical protein EDD90_2002 [Streptomyces sp. Ag109_O5-1]